MKKSLLAFLALAILAIPTICLAAPPTFGPYVSGFVGAAVTADTDVTGSNFDDRVEFDPGINIGGTVGFDYGFMRLEGELSYKQAEIARVIDRIGAETFRNVDGRIGALAVMGNIFFDLHNPSPVTPYLGAGVGFAALHQSDTFGTSTAFGDRQLLYQSDDDSVFAYQAGAGLEIALSSMLSLDLSYRYFRTSRASFNEDTNIDNELRFESHNGAVGIRVKF